MVKMTPNEIHVALGKVDSLPGADKVEEMLRQAGKRHLTIEEIYEQRISLAMGMLPFNSTTTRKYVEDIAKRQLW
jgi:hypothetical protein